MLGLMLIIALLLLVSVGLQEGTLLLLVSVGLQEGTRDVGVQEGMREVGERERRVRWRREGWLDSFSILIYKTTSF